MTSKTTMIEIIGAIGLILVLSLVMLGGPSITGFQAVDFVVEDLDLDITQSQEYSFSGVNPEELVLTSLKLSGEVVGPGRAEVYLDNGRGQRLLIYSNAEQIGSGMDAITGMAAGTPQDPKQGNHLLIQPIEIVPSVFPQLREDQTVGNGLFASGCVDTCFIRMSISSDTRYKLAFIVEPGTELKVDKLFYTLDI